MPKRFTTKECIQRCLKMHKNKFDYSKVSYKSSNIPIEIICPEHGSFFQRPISHYSGQGCPNCSKNKRTTQKSFIEKAKKIHGNKYDYSLIKNIKNNLTKVQIICDVHNVFEQRVHHHLKGSGCPKCFGNVKYTNETFIEKANKIYSAGLYDYSQINYKDIDSKITIICKKHGPFVKSPQKHLKGSGCPKCLNWCFNQQDFIKKSNIVHKNFYDYSLVEYKKSRINIVIICPKHGAFKQIPNNHLNGAKCPRCSNNKISKGQRKLFYNIQKKYPNSILEYKIITKNDKFFYADIFIPETNTIVEYYGDYWHCNPKKYKPNYYHKQKNMIAKDIWDYDLKRKKVLQTLGYNVIVVWECEANNFVKNQPILEKKMTIKQIDSFKVKSKRKHHPMEKKYPGRTCLEIVTALNRFYDDLDDNEKEWLLQGTLVFEEELVSPFFDSLQEGDVIGLGLTKGYEELESSKPAGYKFEIVKVYEGEDKIRVRNVTYKGYPQYEYTLQQELDLCFEEISWAYGMGFADILERDGKMFGVSEEVEWTVNVIGKEDEASGSVSGSSNTQSNSTAGSV